MHKFKHFLTILLSLLLGISSFTIPVSAEGEDSSATWKVIYQLDEGAYWNDPAPQTEYEIPYDPNDINIHSVMYDIPVKEGFTFRGWDVYRSGEPETILQHIDVNKEKVIIFQNPDTAPTENMTFIFSPVWEDNTPDETVHYLTLKLNGGKLECQKYETEIVDEDTVRIPYTASDLMNDVFTLPDGTSEDNRITKSGMKFSGWYTENSIRGYYDLNEIYTVHDWNINKPRDLTITAEWTELSFTLHYVIDADGTEGTTQVCNVGSSTHIGYDAERDGYTLLGWAATAEKAEAGFIDYENDTWTDKCLSDTEDPVYLYAVWQENTPEPVDPEDILDVINEKKAAYEDALQAQNQAQAEADAKYTAYKEAEAVQEQALKDRNNAQKALQEASAVKEQAQQNLNKANAAYEQAQQDVSTAQSNVEAAEAELAQAKAAAMPSQEDIKKASENVDAALNTLHDARAVVDSGSLGFFKEHSGEDSMAVKILEEGIEATNSHFSSSGKTVLGSKLDATNLDNMKKSFEMIAEGNALRASDNNNEGVNKEPLKVTDELMAIAQINANASREEQYHWYYFRKESELKLNWTGENLSLGYPDPYDGWYWEEKEMYDAGETSGTGHYLNLANPKNQNSRRYTVTGYGIAQGGSYRDSQVQEFATNTGLGSGVGVGTIYTLEEYTEQFNAYYDRVHADLSKAEATLKVAEAEFNRLNSGDAGTPEQKEAIRQAEQKLSDAQNALTAAQTALDDASAARNTAQTEYANAESAYTNAKTASDEAQKTWAGKAAEYTRTYNEYLDAKDALDAAIANTNQKKAEYDEALAGVKKVVDIAVSMDEVQLKPGAKVHITASVIPSNADFKGLTWTSSDEAVAAATQDGMITGIKDGTAVITIRSNDPFADVSRTVTVKVETPYVVSYTPVTVVTESGTEPVYPAAVNVLYSDNETREIAVTWNKLTAEEYSVRDGKTYTVSGTSDSTDIDLILYVKVNPALVKSVSEPESVEIPAGTDPAQYLDRYAEVTWTNGDKTQERITWEMIAAEQYSHAGTVTASGTLLEGKLTVTKTLTFYDPSDWHHTPGDVTEEDAASVNFIIPDGLWAAGIPSHLTYTGSAHTFAVRVYNKAVLLKEGKDYTLKYVNNRNAGVHTLDEEGRKNYKPAKKEKKPYILITGKGNYTGKIYVPFDIYPVEKDDLNVPGDVVLNYTGKKQQPQPLLQWDSTLLKKKKDYTVYYLDENGNKVTPKAAGKYTMVTSLKGNYTGEIRTSVEILDPAETLISVAKTKITVKSVPYDVITDSNTGLTPLDMLNNGYLKVTYGKNTVLNYNEDYYAYLTHSTKPGTAVLTICGMGQYTGTKTVRFTITGAPLKNYVSITAGTVEYNGQPQEGITVLGKDGSTLSDDVTYDIQYSKNINAGTAKVTLKGKGGYSGTISKTFKIMPRDMAAHSHEFTVTVNDAVYEKNGAKAPVEVSWNGNSLTKGRDYTVKYLNNKAAGTGTAVISGKGNFKGNLPEQTFTITQKALSDDMLTVPDKVTGVKMFPPVTLKDTNGKKLKAGTDYEKNISYTYVSDTVVTNNKQTTVRYAGEPVAAADQVPAGTYISVAVTGRGNYTGTAVSTFRVLEKNMDIAKAKVTFRNTNGKFTKKLTKTYTGQPITLTKDELRIVVNKKELSPDDYDILSYTKNTEKGTATVTIAGKGNYGGTKTVKFKIASQRVRSWKALLFWLD